MSLGLSQAHQVDLPGLSNLGEAIEALASAGTDDRGAVFTRKEVVEFILDLVGYTANAPLHTYKILEPSFGGGDFLFVVVERLLSSYRRTGRNNPLQDLKNAICAVELHRDSYSKTSNELQSFLVNEGIDLNEAQALCSSWLVRDDFLLTAFNNKFSHVVGNPPYVRQELIPQRLIEEYRRRFKTIYDRADLYVPFIERSLSLLGSGGVLGFICSDRWMKNKYGGPLRRMIAGDFHLQSYVDMVDTAAFSADVVAYPAIFVIGTERGTATRLAYRPSLEKEQLVSLANDLNSKRSTQTKLREVSVSELGSEPWLFECSNQLAIVRRLEAEFPTLEDASCKVGIGVATGADSSFIGAFDDLDVENDCKLPLVMTRDILSGEVRWRGFGVINPFAEAGGLVDLDDYPKLKAYLNARKPEIAKRHVAKRAPANWYRTIDRIYPDLLSKPKLLIPDIKGEAQVVYDEGRYYPHHNLYYITSDAWELHALQAVLLSGIAKLFVSTYSTKMRGGYLRFQAQYLRRIRIPLWEDVSPKLRKRLSDAGRERDQEACNRAVVELYGLKNSELSLLYDTREAA
jgi:hypothetical protein